MMRRHLNLHSSYCKLIFLIYLCIWKNWRGCGFCCDAFILSQRGGGGGGGGGFNVMDQNLSLRRGSVSKSGGRPTIAANLHDIHGLRRKRLFSAAYNFHNNINNHHNSNSRMSMKLSLHLARQKPEGFSTPSSFQTGSGSGSGPGSRTRRKSKKNKAQKVTKLFLMLGSAGLAYYTAGTTRRISSIVSSTLLAHTIYRNIFASDSSYSKEGNYKRTEKGGINDASDIWNDEDRIKKALKKSKRRNAWINQSLTSVEETDRRIAELKAREEAEREAERKRRSKEWVEATMRSARLAREKEEQRRMLDEEKKKKAQQWAESLVRKTGVDLN